MFQKFKSDPARLVFGGRHGDKEYADLRIVLNELEPAAVGVLAHEYDHVRPPAGQIADVQGLGVRSLNEATTDFVIGSKMPLKLEDLMHKALVHPSGRIRRHAGGRRRFTDRRRSVLLNDRGR